MEELKNIKHFQEFKDSLNEELLWDAVKNLFSKIFGSMDKKLADSVSQFTKRLDGSKSWEESIKIYEEFSKKDQIDFETTIKTVNGPLGIRKLLYDNSSRLFLELQELFNKYQSPELASKKIFAGIPMFNYDNSETFVKNAINACNAKIIELNDVTKTYDKALLDAYLKANIKDVKVVQAVGTPTPTPAPATGTPATGTPATGTPATGAAATGTPATGTPATGTPDKTRPVAGAPQGTIPPVIGNLDTLKEASKKWLTDLYGTSIQKVKTVKPTAATIAGKDPFSSIAAGSKGTANKENLAKLLRNIVSVTDAGVLAKIRDNIALAQGKDKKAFSDEIGKF